MISVEKFAALKKEAEKNQREADRAKGAYDQLMEELKDKYGCSTLAAAQKKLDAKRVQLKEAEAKFHELLEEFEKEYGGRLS